jgi:hypothetical protein
MKIIKIPEKNIIVPEQILEIVATHYFHTDKRAEAVLSNGSVISIPYVEDKLNDVMDAVALSVENAVVEEKAEAIEAEPLEEPIMP